MIDPAVVPVRPVRWRPCYRLIPSRFPTVGLFDAIAEPADLEVVFAIEALTNPRIRDEIGQLQLVPPAERVVGAGATPIMAAFTHLNPEGSRFSDGSYGVYYAADTLDCAIAEVRFHREAFLARTREAPIDIDLRVILADLDADLHDLRGLRQRAPELYAPADHGPGQSLGRHLRAAGSAGVVYHSVRHEPGSCVGIFRPRALRRGRTGAHIGMHWNGTSITHWYEKREPNPL